tara:strand:+ start:2128 stop:3735 length:1608 start_codon:yes stop_codon:yes gene_type:complete
MEYEEYIIKGTSYKFKKGTTRQQAINWYNNMQKNEPEKVAEKNLLNAPKETIARSGKQYFSDLWQVISNPIETAKSIGQLGSSVINVIRPGEQGNEALAKAVADYYVERYGGLNNVKQTALTDPVGFVADLSVILSGGAMLPARATGTIGKYANIVKKTGDIIEPITLTSAATKKAIKPVLAKTADLITGKPTMPFLQPSNIGLAYEAGKIGGLTQDALKAGQGNILQSSPILGTAVDKFSQIMGGEKAGLKNLQPKKPKFVNDIIKDLEKLKKENKQNWLNSKDRLELKKIKMSKKEITDILKNAEKNAKMNGAWRSVKDEKLYKNIINMANNIFKANIRKNALGVDMYISQLDELIKNNKKSNLLKDVRQNLKNNIISKSPNYEKLTKGFDEINTIENLTDNILQDKTPEEVLGKLRNIIKNNKKEKKVLNKLNPELNKNLKTFEAGLNMSGQPIGATIVKTAMGTLGEQYLPVPGLALGLSALSNPRIAGNIANVLGRSRKALKPVTTGLGTSARLARTLQQTEDDTYYHNY